MSHIVNFIKGIIVGIAVVIPGLSGSMFAVIVGLYEKMINAVSNLRKEFKKNVLFLLPIVLGGVIGILLSAKLIVDLCEKFPQQSYFFFIGLVLGSIPLVLRKVKQIKFKPIYLLITLFSFGFIMIMGYLSSGETSESISETVHYLTGFSDVIAVFIAGFFSCALMSVPGVSGSVTLMVLGQYNKVYGAVGDCSDMVKYILKGDFDAALLYGKSLGTAIVFAIGGVLGFLIIAKLISRLLLKFEAQVYYGVSGMVLGATVILFTQGVLLDDSFKSIFTGAGLSGGIVGILVIDVLLIAIGVICTLFLDDDSELVQKMKKKGRTENEKTENNKEN